jgi:hypothetical protein
VRKSRLFGPGHIAVLLAATLALGAASQCGKGGDDTPKVCTTTAEGVKDCPLQTGRQDK